MAKPPRKSRPKTIDVSYRKEMENILRTVRHDEPPLEFIQSITLNMKDGTQTHYDIVRMLEMFNNVEAAEEFINGELAQFESEILDVDYYIKIDEVAKIVYPQMDKLLEKCR